MRNKGIIRVFAIAMALVCLYQLLFTWRTYMVEKEARTFSAGDYDRERAYLDSLSNTIVFNFIGLRKYTYKECKEREINLGLDLKGGMNVILEVSVADVVKALSNYNTVDTTFNKALALATKMQQNSQDDFLTLFERAFSSIDPNARLASVFRTPELSDKINFNSSNSDVVGVLRKEANSAIDNAFNIIRSRIDKFGVVQPNIQRLETQGRILVELPGVKEPKRVEKLLEGSANLEFWETYENAEVYDYLVKVNNYIRDTENAASAVKKDTTTVSAAPSQPSAGERDTTGLLGRLAQTGDSLQTAEGDTIQQDPAKEYPLFSILSPSIYNGQLREGSVVGMALGSDTVKVNRYLKMARDRDIFPQKNLRFLWGVKPWKNPDTKKETDFFELHSIKITGRDGRPPLSGDVVTDTRADFRQQGGSTAEVSMTMNHEGAQVWANMTKANKNRCIAIVLDEAVYSAPRVNDEITGGRSQITGDFTINEATDLANILKSGRLPAKTQIIQNEVVGPTLGKESIQAGLMSFIMSLIVVMIYLAFYYSSGGMVADIALLVNMFFLMGVLASLGAVLTLPGIAGIVLTLGMADDANIIIFERIREELRAGKGLRLAVSDGYKNAYSAIIDGNVTTFLTGIVLYAFGSGPIQGFATTLVLGILTSLFCSIFISRLIFERMMDANKTIKFSVPFTANVFSKAKFNFIGLRKRAYFISGTLLAIGLVSVLSQGFNMGIDFTGGRSYTVRFINKEHPQEMIKINTQELQSSLRTTFDNNAPEVKTFGADNQVKITTDYLMSEESNALLTANIDSIVESKLYEGLKPLFPEGTTIEQFRTDHLMSSQKVGASIADDIKRNAVIAVLLSLVVIFLYIFYRFRNWQFGLGAVIALFHDALIIIGMYSLLYKLMPFSLEVDQHFIAAILTIIGYSINDTVIVFDRIREYVTNYPKRGMKEIYNAAINSTLGRTMNTSLSTMFVLLIIFLFGGEMIRGFSFALLIGIVVGTYSSIFAAAPIVYELMNKKRKGLKNEKK
ncbi:MAG: protein translocase subunit SecDF [Bacteroidales bacterium]|jgi:SecD/SecF fusion protein|nr:protein translocase subunit SecDF [Bacteroidales bacterium]